MSLLFCSYSDRVSRRFSGKPGRSRAFMTNHYLDEVTSSFESPVLRDGIHVTYGTKSP